MDYKLAVSNIRKHLQDYCYEHNIKSLVIGVSGGVDSALCCALAAPLCRDEDIVLYGRSLPIISNKPDEIQRAEQVGKHFCNNFKEVNLSQLFYEVYLNTVANENFEPEEKEPLSCKIRKGNIKARLRMIYLYNLASAHNGMVLSTDNYTEYLLGFSTLHGDTGDFGMIQYLWKEDVYKMIDYISGTDELTENARIALLNCMTAVPTDGLGITNSDLDQLEAKSYIEVDNILREYLTEGNHAEHPIVKRYIKTKFKRKNPYNIPIDEIIHEE
jgi:NAD+ synthetase